MKILHETLGFVLNLILFWRLTVFLHFAGCIFWFVLWVSVLLCYTFGLRSHLIDVGEYFVGKILVDHWRLLLYHFLWIDCHLGLETRVNVWLFYRCGIHCHITVDFFEWCTKICSVLIHGKWPAWSSRVHLNAWMTRRSYILLIIGSIRTHYDGAFVPLFWCSRKKWSWSFSYLGEMADCRWYFCLMDVCSGSSLKWIPCRGHAHWNGEQGALRSFQIYGDKHISQWLAWITIRGCRD